MYKLLIKDIKPNNSKRITRTGNRVIHQLTVHAPVNCWQYIDQEDEEYLINEVGAAAMYCRSVAFNTYSCEYKWQMVPFGSSMPDYDEEEFIHAVDLDIQSVFPTEFLHGSVVERINNMEEPAVTYDVMIEHDNDMFVVVGQEELNKCNGDVDRLVHALLANHLNALTRLSIID